jgi:hypothetical protein
VRRALVAVALCLLAAPAAAQYGSFGQNKIQYRPFDWRVLRGEHVDLYYYPEEEELGRVALAYAEESYAVLERRFTHAVTRRIPLIIYASHTDFEQTNLLPFVPPEGLLGFTEFIRRRVALPFRGNYTDFRHTLRHEMVHVFQLSLFGETYARYPRMRSPNMPLWWSEGLAEYFSAGEDAQDEMLLRDMTVGGKLPTLAELEFWGGGVVYALGGAVHSYLAGRYGDWRIAALYRDLWKYESFPAAVQAIYGRRLEDLSAEWQYWMRQRYYPAVTGSPPLALDARLVSRLAIKPAAYRLAGDTATRLLYFSPSGGYSSIFSTALEGGKARALVKGERSEEFESFHYFDSRLDVSPDGVVAFSSRYFDRDALFLWSLSRRGVVGRYQFPELVSILSPTWAPDRQSVVFSALSMSGYSDLYRLWLADGRLERLTSDRYEDRDPSFSPDGTRLVFASDRTAFGQDGARNLFVLDIASGRIAYLTYGAWRDDTPRWARESGHVYFSSDRDGTPQIYEVDSTGSGRRVTNTLNGAFDPQWLEADGGILFGGFADLSFNLYFDRVPAASDTAAADFTLPAASERLAAEWHWPELSDARYARADATPYERKFNLDFAAGDAIVAPGLGTAQGAVFLFSDLLADHLLFLGVSSFQGNGLGNLVSNFNGTVFYLNQARRVNWGVGAFRLRGRFYETDYNTLYDETSFGAFAQVRYPLSRFQRIEGEYRLERSDRFDIITENETAELRREAWLASNYLSFVKDNTLWLATGPIDGERFLFTGGLVNDLTHGRFDAFVLAADLRKYFRTSARSAVAVRALGYHAGGERPRRLSIGGSWALRGYPRWGYVTGTTAWLFNAEWRFPITNFLSVGFPFGELRFPGVQGALFSDYGRAWTPVTTRRGALGSSGLGLRMPIGAPLVLRLDLGYRWHSGDDGAYSLPPRARRSRFVDFFFGFNY